MAIFLPESGSHSMCAYKGNIAFFVASGPGTKIGKIHFTSEGILLEAEDSIRGQARKDR